MINFIEFGIITCLMFIISYFFGCYGLSLIKFIKTFIKNLWKW